MKAITDLLHTLYCTKTHGWELEKIAELRQNDDTCLYYLENVITDSWDCKDHKEWLRIAEKFLTTHELNERQAIQLIQELLEIFKKLEDLETRYPNSKKVFIELLSTDR